MGLGTPLGNLRFPLRDDNFFSAYLPTTFEMDMSRRSTNQFFIGCCRSRERVARRGAVARELSWAAALEKWYAGWLGSSARSEAGWRRSPGHPRAVLRACIFERRREAHPPKVCDFLFGFLLRHTAGPTLVLSPFPESPHPITS